MINVAIYNCEKARLGQPVGSLLSALHKGTGSIDDLYTPGFYRLQHFRTDAVRTDDYGVADDLRDVRDHSHSQAIEPRHDLLVMH